MLNKSRKGMNNIIILLSWIMSISALSYVVPKIITHNYVSEFMNLSSPFFVGIMVVYAFIIFVLLNQT